MTNTIRKITLAAAIAGAAFFSATAAGAIGHRSGVDGPVSALDQSANRLLREANIAYDRLSPCDQRSYAKALHVIRNFEQDVDNLRAAVRHPGHGRIVRALREVNHGFAQVERVQNHYRLNRHIQAAINDARSDLRRVNTLAHLFQPVETCGL